MCHLRVPRENHLWITSAETFRLRRSSHMRRQPRGCHGNGGLFCCWDMGDTFMSASSSQFVIWNTSYGEVFLIKADGQEESPVISNSSLHHPESLAGCKYWSASTFKLHLNEKGKITFLDRNCIFLFFAFALFSGVVNYCRGSQCLCSFHHNCRHRF